MPTPPSPFAIRISAIMSKSISVEPDPIQFNGGTITLFTNPVPNLQLTGGRSCSTPPSGRRHHQPDDQRRNSCRTNTVAGVLNWVGGALGPGSVLTIAPGGIMNIEEAFWTSREP